MSSTNTVTREVPGHESSNGPKKATLEFLRQFARCYRFESSVGVAGDMVLN